MKENRELDEFEEEYGGGTKNGEHHVNKMGEMSINRLIFSMSWPAVLSMFIQAFYNVVDISPITSPM